MTAAINTAAGAASTPGTTTPAQSAAKPSYEWGAMAPFIAVHLAPLAAFWVDISWQAWAVCAGLYVARMFGITGGYHRYFSHRSYKMGRFMQLGMAILAQTSAQRGVLWWAGHHRDHHKYSDTNRDIHSPRQQGVLYAHVGWLYNHNSDTKFDRVRDLARFPELVWLNKHWLVPPTALGVACFLLGGWDMLLIGFCLSTVLLWHGTFVINSLCHVFGRTRYKTGDDSKNSLILALITLGEGWHNNHHYYQRSTRQGFFWWEIDVTYYVLKALSWVGLTWDLHEPPQRVLDQAKPAGS